MNWKIAGAVILAMALIAAAVIAMEFSRRPPQIPIHGEVPSEVLPRGEPSGTTAVSPTVSGPPSFTLIVTPVEARAKPGSAILYTMSIEPKGGFDKPVSLRLDVSALFLYRNSFDLGTVSPPYPQTFEYLFRVPPDAPAGISVKGVLSAEGGGHREEQGLILLIEK